MSDMTKIAAMNVATIKISSENKIAPAVNVKNARILKTVT